MPRVVFLIVLGLGALAILPPAQAAPLAEPGRFAAIQGAWNTPAKEHRGRNGERFTYSFPPHGVLSGNLWGTGLYTDDSSIATAAVQEGLITPKEGGVVTIEIRPGADAYRGSDRNGVKSGSFGPWAGSFVFVDRREGRQEPPPPSMDHRRGERAQQGDWQTKAKDFRGRNGERLTFTFPYGTPSAPVWGSGLYTDDSSIAAAAVHAGLLSADRGGTVTIEICAGASSYQGNERNGVRSEAYGPWAGSFVFVDWR